MIRDNFGKDENYCTGWFKVAFKTAGPLMKWWSVSPRECGERVVFLAMARFPARGTGLEGKGDVAMVIDSMSGGSP
jgi:hypothetical protein